MNSLSWPGPEPLEVTTLCRSTAARKNARARGSLVKPNCPKLSKAMCLCQVRIAMIAMTSPRTHVLACWLRLWALELGPHIVASGFIPSSRGMGSLLLRVFISGFFSWPRSFLLEGYGCILENPMGPILYREVYRLIAKIPNAQSPIDIHVCVS